MDFQIDAMQMVSHCRAVGDSGCKELTIMDSSGIGLIRATNLPRNSWWRVDALDVVSGYRRRRMGSILLAELEQVLQNQGALVLYFDLPPEEWMRLWLKRRGYDNKPSNIYSKVISRTATLKQQIREVLLKAVPDDFMSGICDYVQNQLSNLNAYNDIREILIDIWKPWEYYSGNPDFPVPAPSFFEYAVHMTHKSETVGDRRQLAAELSFRLARNGFGSLTDGEYGKKRMELKNFIIQELEK